MKLFLIIFGAFALIFMVKGLEILDTRKDMVISNDLVKSIDMEASIEMDAIFTEKEMLLMLITTMWVTMTRLFIMMLKMDCGVKFTRHARKVEWLH